MAGKATCKNKSRPGRSPSKKRITKTETSKESTLLPVPPGFEIKVKTPELHEESKKPEETSEKPSKTKGIKFKNINC